MRIPKHLYLVWQRCLQKSLTGLISNVLKDYSTHDETCTLYTGYSVHYVVYISMVSPKQNFSISFHEGHVMFCFALAKFCQIGERNKILPHISIWNFADKFLRTNYFASAKYLQKFWQNKPRFCPLVLQFNLAKFLFG